MTDVAVRIAESCRRFMNLRACWPRYALNRIRERYISPTASTVEFQLTSPDCCYALWARHGTSDIHVFRQIFADREYRPFDDLDRMSSGLVIDAGANVGYSSAYFLSRFPKCQVISIEPDPENASLMRRNLSPYAPRVQFVEAAVWSESCKLSFDSKSYRDGAHWSRQVRRSADGEAAEVQAVDVMTLLDKSGHEQIWILKIDIERAERVLFSAGCEQWLRRVQNLVIELHDQECRDVFFSVVSDREFAISYCGELTFCRRVAESEPQRPKGLLKGWT